MDEKGEFDFFSPKTAQIHPKLNWMVGFFFKIFVATVYKS